MKPHEWEEVAAEIAFIVRAESEYMLGDEIAVRMGVRVALAIASREVDLFARAGYAIGVLADFHAGWDAWDERIDPAIMERIERHVADRDAYAAGCLARELFEESSAADGNPFIEPTVDLSIVASVVSEAEEAVSTMRHAIELAEESGELTLDEGAEP